MVHSLLVYQQRSTIKIHQKLVSNNATDDKTMTCFEVSMVLSGFRSALASLLPRDLAEFENSRPAAEILSRHAYNHLTSPSHFSALSLPPSPPSVSFHGFSLRRIRRMRSERAIDSVWGRNGGGDVAPHQDYHRRKSKAKNGGDHSLGRDPLSLSLSLSWAAPRKGRRAAK